MCAAAFLLAVVVFSGALVWDGLADGDGLATMASTNDGYYITEFHQNAR